LYNANFQSIKPLYIIAYLYSKQKFCANKRKRGQKNCPRLTPLSTYYSRTSMADTLRRVPYSAALPFITPARTSEGRMAAASMGAAMTATVALMSEAGSRIPMATKVPSQGRP